jgi:hypothetical protein
VVGAVVVTDLSLACVVDDAAGDVAKAPEDIVGAGLVTVGFKAVACCVVDVAGGFSFPVFLVYP